MIDPTGASDQFVGLPGGRLLARGLSELRLGQRGFAGLLVALAAPRLVPLGLVTMGDVVALQRGNANEPAIDDLELAAYRALLERHGRGAHARYLALDAELQSALNALEREQRKVGTHALNIIPDPA